MTDANVGLHKSGDIDDGDAEDVGAIDILVDDAVMTLVIIGNTSYLSFDLINCSLHTTIFE